MTQEILVNRDGSVWWLIFNRPQKKNAISAAMSELAVQTLEAYTRDETARVLIVTGAGDECFTSGADISELHDSHNGSSSLPKGAKIAVALQQVTKPTIAMINGYCLGGGVAIAASCDLRFCSDDASFGIPAARLGVSYRISELKLLVDLIGPAHVKEIMFTAQRYTADRAQAVGLVNLVISKGNLEDHVRQCAEAIANNAPLSHSATKTIVNEILKGADCDLRVCEDVFRACLVSQDFKDATQAFMQKRKPTFRGR